MFVEQNLLQVPPGADVIAFVRNGGKIEEPAAPPPERVIFSAFKKKIP